MRYNKIISTFFLLFIWTISFGQKNIDITIPNIKSTKDLWYNQNNNLCRIIYETYDVGKKLTTFKMLEGDSTQIMRRSYEYNNNGFLISEGEYNIADDTLPSSEEETIYDKADKIIQKRTYSNFKKKKILSSKGLLIAKKTISNSGEITNRALYVYKNELLIEIRYLNKKNEVWKNELFKYNDLKRKIEEIHISNNVTISKYLYKYNDNGQVIKKIFFREKKEETKKNEKKEDIETIEIIETLTIDDSVKSYPSVWKHWEEEEIYETDTYVYNEYNLVILHKTDGQTEFKGTLKNVFEYDKYGNWVKCTTERFGSHWRTSIREIEYY
ncbi:hypothetical protein CXF68_17950 [Tenacibaculum sp. Bg11-29]|uniref:hypothetical protein n=1 Tax=Tenacibaculum sp. Bg11-29 TaxID=2058306 RepID=UPI000C32F1C6|nr:hypothetical protein [Tenacibaculum sp. Bg11-29]PKH52460.1 hypothetical protein CXF68_17950 [Tenacibaculum sp. Bg11-29]